MKVTPTCRYGHGDLEKVERSDPDHYWAFMGINIMKYTAGMPAGEPLTSTSMDGTVFAVALYRCKTCGYIECFDSNGGIDG